MNIQKIKSPTGEEMVVLSMADYLALTEAANEAAEDAADVAAYDAAIAGLSAQDVFPPDLSALITAGNRRLKAIRKWRGLGQVELAAAAEIAQGHLSDIENGRRNLTPELAARMAQTLDVPLAWLL